MASHPTISDCQSSSSEFFQIGFKRCGAAYKGGIRLEVGRRQKVQQITCTKQIEKNLSWSRKEGVQISPTRQVCFQTFRLFINKRPCCAVLQSTLFGTIWLAAKFGWSIL